MLKPERFVPWALLLSAATLYLSLGQGTLYGDGPGILLTVNGGDAFGSRTHYLHGPMLLGLWSLMGPFGVSLHQAGVVLSCMGAAVGVSCVYYASRMLFGGWRRPALIAGIVATCPATMFYATVVELHGPFLAFFGLVALAVANLALRPTMANAILLGAATGLAALAHASAHLLPVVALLLCPVLASWRGTQIQVRRWLVLIGAQAVVHGMLVGITLGLVQLRGSGARPSVQLPTT